jgi:glycerol-3-phosphate dehydrogenase
VRSESWDLLVVGGGITGATIMREAARRGLRVLLVEQHDFAAGTSSRSSKLIHGGLHYLARRQVGLSRTLVHERERLLHTAEGLVEPVEFLVPLFSGDRLRRWGVGAGICLYEAFAGRLRVPHHLDRAGLDQRLVGLAPDVVGAIAFSEATVDDARLVIRTLSEGRRLGGYALNYVAATGLLRDRCGRIVGAVLRDQRRDATLELHARAVVNATGAWSDGFRGQTIRADGVRLVRGSHLVFPKDRLPVDCAVAVRHPESGEAFSAVPWEGATIVGSTSVDHDGTVPDDPRPSEAELAYLLRGARWLFPSLDLDWPDILAVFAGIRAITDRTTREASRASRDFAVRADDGMWTVVGGKLSTARSAANEALDAIFGPARRQPTERSDQGIARWEGGAFDQETAHRLVARYGLDGLEAISTMRPDERCPIPGHRVLWAELRWSARREDVRHLSDLLLRRVRLGVTSAGGGACLLEAIRPIVQEELAWDDDRWEREVRSYLDDWHHTYGATTPVVSPVKIDASSTTDPCADADTWGPSPGHADQQHRLPHSRLAQGDVPPPRRP